MVTRRLGGRWCRRVMRVKKSFGSTPPAHRGRRMVTDLRSSAGPCPDRLDWGTGDDDEMLHRAVGAV